MDIHPWTKYEIARIRDEERLLRAREASLVRDARAFAADVGEEDVNTSWFRWLRRRNATTEPATVRPRPV
jgi:hypothetical protein